MWVMWTTLSALPPVAGWTPAERRYARFRISVEGGAREEEEQQQQQQQQQKNTNKAHSYAQNGMIKGNPARELLKTLLLSFSLNPV